MPVSPSTLRIGTSSWAYEGWQGRVYRRTYPKSRFSQDTLAVYATLSEPTPSFGPSGRA